VGVRVQARYLCLLLQCPSALRNNGEERFGLLCAPWITPIAGEPAPICVGMFELGAGIAVDVASGNTVPRPITPVVLPMDAVPAPANRVDGGAARSSIVATLVPTPPRLIRGRTTAWRSAEMPLARVPILTDDAFSDRLRAS
jgi:hypothetical protein